MTEFLTDLLAAVAGMTLFEKYTVTFFISMLPIIELRGAIPFAAALGLNLPLSFLICIIGNCIPVPFIVLFGRTVVNKLKKTKLLGWFGRWMENKVSKNKEKVLKYQKLGLMFFVGIPLPGTGAWTGSVIASFLDLKLKNAFFPTFFGVVMAGVIMLTLSFFGIQLWESLPA